MPRGVSYVIALLWVKGHRVFQRLRCRGVPVTSNASHSRELLNHIIFIAHQGQRKLKQPAGAIGRMHTCAQKDTHLS